MYWPILIWSKVTHTHMRNNFFADLYFVVLKRTTNRQHSIPRQIFWLHKKMTSDNLQSSTKKRMSSNSNKKQEIDYM